MISVGSGEKGRFDISFVCRAEGGHAAAPWGRVNPLAELGKLLARIAEWQPEAYPASPVFGYLGGAIGIAEGIVKANLAEAIGKIDALAPALGRSLRAQSRMTLTPTILHGGEGSNVIPSEARLICDSRLLPGQMREALESVVRGLAEGIAGLES